MKTGTENYSKVEVLNLELNLGNISVIYNTNKPKYNIIQINLNTPIM